MPLKTHGKDPFRYVMGVLYLLELFLLGITIVPLTPIGVTVRKVKKNKKKVYEIESSTVTFTTSLYSLAVFIGSIPGIMISERIGIKHTMRLGSALLAIGMLLRTLINQWFYVVIIGQIVAGLSASFISNMKAKFISEWFSAKEVNITFIREELGLLYARWQIQSGVWLVFFFH